MHTAGWATCTWLHGGQAIAFPVSYLRDSLGDLAELAIALAEGALRGEVRFSNEPGETVLQVQGEGHTLDYRLIRVEQWGHDISDAAPIVLAEGGIPRGWLVAGVYEALRRIFLTIGPGAYQRRWLGAPFPKQAYRELGAFLGAHSHVPRVLR